MFPKTNLVGGLEHEFDFSIYLPVIIPTDELIFFRGVGIPLTSNPMTFMTGLDSLGRLVWEARGGTEKKSTNFGGYPIISHSRCSCS